jgi:hypothetical protein
MASSSLFFGRFVCQPNGTDGAERDLAPLATSAPDLLEPAVFHVSPAVHTLRLQGAAPRDFLAKQADFIPTQNADIFAMKSVNVLQKIPKLPGNSFHSNIPNSIWLRKTSK